MKKGKMNQVEANIWLCVILLSVFGCIIILSASAAAAAASKDCDYDMLYYVKKQGTFLAVGLGLMLVARYVNYNILKYFAIPAYLASIACIFLLRTGLGVRVNGAIRWIRLGPVQFQVAELVKVSTILALAFVLSICTGKIGKYLIVVFLWVFGAFMAVLLYKVSNDLSSAIVVLGITFFISFVCTRTVLLHVVAVILAGARVYRSVMEVAGNLPTPEEIETLPFRTARIAAWLAPERYSLGKAYQTLQTLYSFGSGGFLGRGLGAGIQKGKIPEVHTDMIFSVIAEELGIPGVAMVIVLIVFLAYKIMIVSVTAENILGSVVALGVMAHITIQSIINIAVNVNLFPNTGLPLPFVSYGGSSICFLMLEMAFLVAIERYHSIQAQKRVMRHEVHFGNIVLDNVPLEELLEDAPEELLEGEEMPGVKMLESADETIEERRKSRLERRKAREAASSDKQKADSLRTKTGRRKTREAASSERQKADRKTREAASSERQKADRKGRKAVSSEKQRAGSRARAASSSAGKPAQAARRDRAGTANEGGIYTRYTKSTMSRESIERRRTLENEAKRQQAARETAEKTRASRYAKAADRRKTEADRDRRTRRTGRSS